MSSKHTKNIFRKEGLTRADIERYGKSSDLREKQAIEQKAESDPFQSDALEGWEQLSYAPSKMDRLDKRFAPKTSFGTPLIVGGLVTIIGVVAILVYVNRPASEQHEAPEQKEQLSSLLEHQEIVLDESDVVIPELIERMQSAPKKVQVPAKKMIQEFREIKETRIEEPDLPIAELPLIDIDISTPEAQEIIRKHEFAKEMYLHDLKLVDYRAYREKPQVKTRQMVLSGTPANKENEASEEPEAVWKDVDIPYIEFIDKTMRIFASGNFKKALSRCETVLETYPMDVNANFYAGICLYNLGQYSDAIEHFDTCINGPYSNFDEEALWMKAQSLEKSGQASLAKRIYQKIAEGGGYYAAQATQKLK